MCIRDSSFSHPIYCRLVQAKRPKLCQPRMPQSNSYSNAICILRSIIATDINSQEGNTTIIFVQDLDSPLAAKTCPHRPQPLQRVNNDQAFPQEETIFPPIFYMEPIPGTPGHAFRTFRANILRSDCVGSTSSNAYRPKFIPLKATETKQSKATT